MSGSFESSAAGAAMAVYDLAFQISPIILVNGIAAGSPGGMLPIIALTGQLAAFVQGVASGGLNTDAFFAKYLPVPGSTFISQSIGNYPLANQQTAGNALIRNPLTLSLLMLCPVQSTLGYLTKLPILSAFKQSLDQHNLLGGLYNIATPAYIFQNGVMLDMVAVDSGQTNQQYTRFQLDFWFPLVTQAQAQQAQGNLMQTATNGGQISGTPAWTGLGGAGSGFSGLPASVSSILSSPIGAL